MDKATLVKSDVDITGRILVALSKAKIPVTLCALDYVPQLDEWQLIIATPWYDSKGPHEANAKVISALQEEGIYPETPIRRIYVRSPNDPIVRTIELELKTQTEGTLHIVASIRRNDTKQYSMIFAPYYGSGGAMPARSFSNTELLREFLEKRLHIDRSTLEEALAELDRKRVTSIFHVRLSRKQAKSLGLA